MNNQTLDLNKMGLAPMQSSDMQEVDGGFMNPAAVGQLVNSFLYGVAVGIGNAILGN